MKIHSKVSMILLVLAVALASACSGSKYVEPSKVPTDPALDFNPNDLQFIAEKMTQSLLDTKIFEGGEPPILRVTEIRNKTSEHIDTKAITDKVRTALIKSRKVRFVRDKGEEFAEEDQFKEFKEQSNPSGRGAIMDEKAKLKAGHMQGPKYHLYGEIVSITNVAGSRKDVYYKMTLNLMNLEAGTLDWAEEKELRKVREKSLFGM